MKLIYGNTPVKSLNINYYELNTNDCDMIASDLQAGKTAVARGQKITGTGKCFEFASYGITTTNIQSFVPTSINVVEITSTEHPIKGLIGFDTMVDVDFTTEQTIAVVIIDNVEYPITVKVEGYILTFNCEKNISLNYFIGKDNYTWWNLN